MKQLSIFFFLNYNKKYLKFNYYNKSLTKSSKIFQIHAFYLIHKSIKQL
jgi:hypothetical protein